MVDLHLLLFISNFVICNSCLIPTYYRLQDFFNKQYFQSSGFQLFKSKIKGTQIKMTRRLNLQLLIRCPLPVQQKSKFNAFKSRSIFALSVIYFTLIPFNRTRIYPIFSIYTICTILEHFEDLSNRMNLGKYCAESLKNLKSFEFILISLLNCDRFQ